MGILTVALIIFQFVVFSKGRLHQRELNLTTD
jgi:hypothetical protein